MFAKEIFNPPQKKTYGKPKFNRKLINITFDKSINTNLCNSLTESLQQENFTKNALIYLEKQHYFMFLHNNQQLKITSEMISIELKTKNVLERQYVPSIIEPSFGISRILYALFEHRNYVPKEGNRVIMKFKPIITPIKCAVIPLITQNIIVKQLRSANILCKIDCSGASIGKQYSRYDELGVPYIITVDHDTIKKDDLYEIVTIRDRDTRNQYRINIDDISSEILNLLTNL